MFKSAWNSIAKRSQIRISDGFKFVNEYKIECIKPDGSLRWVMEDHNLVVNVGLNDVLDKYFKGSAYTAAFFVGLASASPTFAAGDTMASHGGWTEVTDYTEAARPDLTLGSVSGQSVSNTASKAVFTVNNTVSIGGAFITTDDTVGGTDGVLYGGAAFTNGNRSAIAGDELRVTCTLTAASA